MSGEGAGEAALTPRGGSFLSSSLVISGLENRGSLGTSAIKKLMANEPSTNTQCNSSLLTNVKVSPRASARLDLRPSYISQLLAVPWRDE